jgi:hypothetical protein
MGEKRTDLLRGTLDLLILKALSLEPLHGVGVSRRITQVTKGAFQVSFGSLFPSLYRMEEKGWVARLAKQSPGEILPVDCIGPRTAQGRGTRLEPGGQDHDGSGGIRLKSEGMHHGNANLEFYPKPLR